MIDNPLYRAVCADPEDDISGNPGDWCGYPSCDSATDALAAAACQLVKLSSTSRSCAGTCRLAP